MPAAVVVAASPRTTAHNGWHHSIHRHPRTSSTRTTLNNHHRRRSILPVSTGNLVGVRPTSYRNSLVQRIKLPTIMSTRHPRDLRPTNTKWSRSAAVWMIPCSVTKRAERVALILKWDGYPALAVFDVLHDCIM